MTIAKYMIRLVYQVTAGFNGASTPAFTPPPPPHVTVHVLLRTRIAVHQLSSPFARACENKANGINQLTPFNTTLDPSAPPCDQDCKVYDINPSCAPLCVST